MLKNKLKNKKKGFTLIELIVVLAVLAIIALIAIPNFNQIRENSKIKSDERSADLIDKAVTTLVLDGSIGDGTYTFVGETVSVLTGSAGSEGDKTKIQKILDPAKVQQHIADSAKRHYTISISNSATDDPKVAVAVGGYNSDSLTK